MSKTLIAVVVVAVVALGGYFILRSNKMPENAPMENQVSEQSGEKSAEKKMAFSEFIKQGGSYKCEVKQAMSDFENSGTIYLNGDKMRGEFTTVAEGRTIMSTFISKDGWMYTWSSASPGMGFKEKTVKSPGTDESDIYHWNADQIGDYNCEAWTADQSKFDLPAGVTFKLVGAAQ